MTIVTIGVFLCLQSMLNIWCFIKVLEVLARIEENNEKSKR